MSGFVNTCFYTNLLYKTIGGVWFPSGKVQDWSESGSIPTSVV